jgi:hypothetical protein
MKVSMDKKYVTRNGKHDAKIVLIGEYLPGFPVLVDLINKDTGHIKYDAYTLSGGFLSDVENHPLDLIEVPEEKPAPTLDDYYNAFVYVWNPAPTVEEGHREGIKAVLELAGVKV